jgi:acyl-CoA thioester hydrolase
MEEDRFTMRYAVVSHRHGKLAAEGDGVIVMFNYREGKKTAMPEEIRKRLLSLEGQQL